MLHQFLDPITIILIIIIAVLVFKNYRLKQKNQNDIADIKNSAKALESAKETAEESTRLKSEFLANMSHEIRTPLNGIVGMSYLALQTDLTNKQRDYVQRIRESGENLLNIINDILDFSKIEAGKLKLHSVDFELKKVVDDVVEILKFSAYEKDLKLYIHYDKDLKKFYHGDSLKLGQILTNLIGNAIKFTHEGQIDVYVESTKDDMCRFTIKDTGIGLRDEQIGKLFKSFSQADGSTTRKYGGTGLGLSISKYLVELMDGDIWVESEFGKGSSFIFEIPLKQSDTDLSILPIQDDAVDTLEKNMMLLKGSKILLAEDNKINQEIIVGLLENFKIDIDVAHNGKEAVQKATDNDYELILMDLQMPLLDGYGATKEIKKLKKDIPIIALSANATKDDVNKSKTYGINKHLDKPIEIKKLYTALIEYISKKIDVANVIDKEIQEEVSIPKFKSIDVKEGLKYLNANKKLYISILQNFKKTYTDVRFEEMDDDEFKIAIHTIKGLSANIGAYRLNDIAIKLDKTQDKVLLKQFYAELNMVLKDLEKLDNIGNKKTEKLSLGEEEQQRLFATLKEFASKRRSRECHKVIDELDKYNLKSQADLLLDIKIYLDNREYKKIVESILVGDAYDNL